MKALRFTFWSLTTLVVAGMATAWMWGVVANILWTAGR